MAGKKEVQKTVAFRLNIAKEEEREAQAEAQAAALQRVQERNQKENV